MENNILIETFSKGDFKIELRKARTESGSYIAGGMVYYKDKFIKLIPYGSRPESHLKKYMEYLVDNSSVSEIGIYIEGTKGEGYYYHYFESFAVY